MRNDEHKYVAGLSSSQEEELRKTADKLGLFDMEKKMLTEIQGMLEDINPNEIVSHILDGTLLSWLASWRMETGMLVAFMLENVKLSERDG